MSTVTATKNGKPTRNAAVADEFLETEGRGIGEEYDPASDILGGPAPVKPVKRGGRRKVLLAVLGALLLVGGAVAVLFYLHAQRYESTDDATIEGHIVAISPQISARVKAVRVKDNQAVAKGDELVELDDTDYQVALDQARAAESAAKGKLSEAQAKVQANKATRDEAKAEVAVAEANAEMARADHERYVDASQRNAGSISKQQLDNSTANWRSTEAQVEQARAKLAAAEAQITTADAAVDSAKGDLAKASADVHKAEVNLSYCIIKAPEAGRIAKKNVEPGSYVQAGQNLLAVIPSDFWVVANFKETQLDRIHPDQRVTISVDAYPGKVFTGKVDSMQSGTGSRFSVLPAENATGNFVKVVQRVPVKITFDPGQTDDPGRPLAAGMSVVPEVSVK